MGGTNIDLNQEEIWDDSALIDSWNEALAEYKKYHSVHAKGGSLKDIEALQAESSSNQQEKSTTIIKGDQNSEGEVEEAPASVEAANAEAVTPSLNPSVVLGSSKAADPIHPITTTATDELTTMIDSERREPQEATNVMVLCRILHWPSRGSATDNNTESINLYSWIHAWIHDIPIWDFMMQTLHRKDDKTVRAKVKARMISLLDQASERDSRVVAR